MKQLIVAALIALTDTPALAWDNAERNSTALTLAHMLGAEQPCGFSYDHEAIAAWIDAKVPADDMEFAKMLDFYAMDRTKEMTASEKVAYCHQIGRSARAAGFMQ